MRPYSRTVTDWSTKVGPHTPLQRLPSSTSPFPAQVSMQVAVMCYPRHSCGSTEFKRCAQDEAGLLSTRSWTWTKPLSFGLFPKVVTCSTIFIDMFFFCFFFFVGVFLYGISWVCLCMCTFREVYLSVCVSHILHLLLLAFSIFSLGTCCDSFSISKSMQSKICQ